MNAELFEVRPQCSISLLPKHLLMFEVALKGTGSPIRLCNFTGETAESHPVDPGG